MDDAGAGCDGLLEQAHQIGVIAHGDGEVELFENDFVATLTLLPGLGHVPHLQDPPVFYAALLKFLHSDAPVSGAAR